MTMQTYASIEYGERLASIANAYTKLGYNVKKAPSSAELPDFLRQFQPDLVAQKPGENLVVELKNKVHARPLSYWLGLEDALKKHPDWKLQLIDAGSLDMDLAPGSEPSTKATILERIRQAEDLLHHDQMDLAVVIGFGALEASMRATMSANNLPWNRTSTLTLIAGMLDANFFTSDEADLVRQVMAKRNSIVHGFSGSPIDLIQVKALIELTEELTGQL